MPPAATTGGPPSPSPSTSTSTSTMTATDGVDDGSTESTTSGGVPFLVPPDGGSGKLQCSTYLQDCPRGEKCMPYANDGGSAWNALSCFPVDPMPDLVGQACTAEGSGVSGVDSCELGAMCWDVDPATSEGTCVAMCVGTPDEPLCDDPETRCITANDGALALCLPVCDPLADECGPGQACALFQCSLLCVPQGAGPGGVVGDPCEFVNTCDPGLYCAPQPDVPGCNNLSGCCAAYCYLDDPGSPCQPGQVCTPFDPVTCGPDPAFDNLGRCAAPP